MRDPRRTTAAVLAGAAVLASGAYAIGNEQGDGGAIAAPSRAAESGPMVERAPGPPPGAHDRRVHRAPAALPLRRIARRLGVTTAELRSALREARPERPERMPLSGGLADKLGVSEEQLREAFRALHEQREAELASELAAALGLDASAVESALEEQRSEAKARHEQMRADFVKRLADALGIPESRVEDALPRMPHPQRHGPGHGPW